MVKVFYDGQCYLCDGEVNHYKKYQQTDVLEWIDITAPNFNADAFGLNAQALDLSLHTLDEHGNIQTGIDSFIVIWKRLPKPYPTFATLIRLPIIYSCAKIAYACFAKMRMYLPKKKKHCEYKATSNKEKR